MSLQYLIDQGFPLIKLKERSKVPAESWRQSERRKRPAGAFKNYNVAVKCGTRIPGGFLVVVDVDVRNGGDDSLKALEEKHDNLPNTMVVKTGGGGRHYYFVSKARVGKGKLAPGIDIQGHGSYVVGPGSVHESGQTYEIIERDELAQLPNWIPEQMKHPDKVGGNGKGFFNADDEVKDYGKRVSKGQRNEFLTHVGGKFRRLGADAEEIEAMLAVTNRKRCDPPVPEAEVRQIAKSVSRYVGETLSEGLAPIVTQPVKKPPKKTKTLEPAERLHDVYVLTTGLVRDIADAFHKNAPRPYEHFSLASALAILSGCAQASYSAPNLGDQAKPGGGLSLYQWLTAPAASGKESYRAGVERYLKAVDERLVCGRIGSFYGLRCSLYGWNSKVYVIDEIQDELTRFANSMNSPLSQVITEMKELANYVDKLAPVVIKDRIFSGICSPKFSVFGLGTTSGFLRHLNGHMIGGGLLSRFIVWPQMRVPDFHYGRMLAEIDQGHIDALSVIQRDGITDVGRTQNYEEQITTFAGIVGKKGQTENAPEHIPQTVPRWVVMADDKAKKMLVDFHRLQESRYREAIKVMDEEVSPGAIYDRSAQVALKIACLHAIGRAQATIDSLDSEVGIRLASVLADTLGECIDENASGSRSSHMHRRVMRKIRQLKNCQKVTKRTLLRALMISAKELDSVLRDLNAAGCVMVIDDKGQERDIESAQKINRLWEIRLADQ